MKFEIELKFEVEVEVWIWSLKLKFEVEVWSWILKLKFEIEVEVQIQTSTILDQNLNLFQILSKGLSLLQSGVFAFFLDYMDWENLGFRDESKIEI